VKKAALIYNPFAGSSRTERGAQIEAAAGVLRASGVEVLSIATRGPGSATDQAMEAVAGGCDTVIACGGDGTVHECMQRMVAERAPAALGVMPFGTGNALGNDLGIPRDALRAARLLLTARAERIAVGRMEPEGNPAAGRYFIVTAGIGGDAHMLYRLNFEAKRRQGMRAYYTAAIQIFVQHGFPPFEIEFATLDGSQRSLVVSQALAVRISNFGGLIRRLAPGAALHRNDMRLVLFRTPRRRAFLTYLFWRFFGAPWLPRNVDLVSATTAVCRPLPASTPLPGVWREEQRNARIHAEADGELLGTIPVRIFSVPDALTILVPRSRSGWPSNVQSP
jgi:diacylglycerol kinase (ATP)